MIAVFIAGLASPLFLFLAGLTLAMAASAQRRDGRPRARRAPRRAGAAGRSSRSRSCSACSRSCSAGARSVNFLKVDILNVMGVAMVAAALLWGMSAQRAVADRCCSRSRRSRSRWSRRWCARRPWLAPLPDAIEAYLRPLPGRTTFALFPWAGFLFAGAIAGELVDAARTEAQERRLQAGLLVAGVAGIALGYCGVVPAVDLSGRELLDQLADVLLHPPRHLRPRWCRSRAASICSTQLVRRSWRSAAGCRARVIATLGRSSLFVYWIHVEMVYGVHRRPLKRALPLEASLVGDGRCCALLLYGDRAAGRTA